jgi:hypothetical protein
LKALIEESKTNSKPLFACFVDFKKAFDTVWRNGLFFKLLNDYKISPKCVRMINSMYSKLSSRVKINGELSEQFEVSIGLRQGCNLSPHLFNLYIDDFARLLGNVNYDSPKLNNINISSLLYADDMLILSTSKTGLQKV